MQSYINVRLDGSSSTRDCSSSIKRKVLPRIRYSEENDRRENGGGKHGRIKYWLRKFITFLFSQVGVGSLLLLYTIMGATIFLSLETPRDPKMINEVLSLRSQVVLKLWNVTLHYNTIYSEKWEAEVDFTIRDFQNNFVKKIRLGYNGEDDDAWTFPKALMYSLSVYTTIGYGNLTPKTSFGKCVTCFYALFGIPLLLLYMANVGDLLATSFREFYTSLDRCKGRIELAKRRREELETRVASGPEGGVMVVGVDWPIIKGEEDDDDEEQVSSSSSLESNTAEQWTTNEVTIPMSTCLSLFFFYIAAGSIFFSWCEDWNYLDGSYFCFVSLVTIGFGDFVPGQTLGSSENAQQVDGQLILCSIYILLGMALMAMCFHLTQERFFIAAKKLGKALHLV